MSRFIWYELMTTDPASAMRFYPGVTGWHATLYGGGESSHPYWLWMNGEEAIGGLMALPQSAEQGGAYPHWMPYVECADVEAMVAQARALGARVYVPPTDIGSGRFAVLADPQGAVFSVFAPAAPTPPRGARQEGAVAWHELVTADAAAAMEFYGTLFGWRSTGTVELGTGGAYHTYGDGGESHGGIYDRSRNSAMPSHWLLHFRVRDLDRATSCVRQLGGQVLQLTRAPDGSEIAECVDPQGARFALTLRAT